LEAGFARLNEKAALMAAFSWAFVA